MKCLPGTINAERGLIKSTAKSLLQVKLQLGEFSLTAIKMLLTGRCPGVQESLEKYTSCVLRASGGWSVMTSQ
jgi:hypothetical protein